jgi:hypothetical protein
LFFTPKDRGVCRHNRGLETRTFVSRRPSRVAKLDGACCFTQHVKVQRLVQSKHINRPNGTGDVPLGRSDWSFGAEFEDDFKNLFITTSFVPNENESWNKLKHR